MSKRSNVELFSRKRRSNFKRFKKELHRYKEFFLKKEERNRNRNIVPIG
jgi:hypothetical protein